MKQVIRPQNSSKFLVAKIDVETNTWLPLWVHSADTCFVMKYLINSWLPKSTFFAMGLEKEECIKAASLLAMVHDIGKASLTFQSKITENAPQLRYAMTNAGLMVPSISDPDCADREKLPHGAAGELLLLLKDMPMSYAVIVGAHHGMPWIIDGSLAYDIKNGDRESLIERGLYDFGSNLWGNESRKQSWMKVQEQCFHWMIEQVGDPSWDSLPTLTAPAAVLLTGLVITADWIASNTDYFPLLSENETEPEDIDKRFHDGIEKLQLPPSWKPEVCFDVEALSQKRFGFSPNAVQKAILDAIQESEEPGLFILEAPMGVGKTEAALLSAEMLSSKKYIGGIFFGLPTQATANGIFERVVAWGQNQTEQNQASIRLAHGMAQMNELYQKLFGNGQAVCVDADGQEENRLIAHEWFQGSKKALLADFVVGTVDQFLMASLQQKHVMLRHLGLCGKAVIIDECHAYDAYMSQYLEGTLKWLGQYHTPVIMLSATLPYERRAAFMDAYLNRKTRPKDSPAPWRTAIGYPLLTWSDHKNVKQIEIPYAGSRKTIHISRIRYEKDLEKQAVSITALLQQKLKKGGCAAVIVNTVQRAQAFATALRQAMPEYDVLLLHSQYIMPERLRHENELLERVGKHSERSQRDRFIVVGTQVIEQSLDFDVDLMITDLCPMDLLLQRLGRLHRHPQHDVDRPEELRQAQCYLLCAEEEIEGGAAAVYGEYLLMRTRTLMPEQITLPDDISPLVQKVYDVGIPLPQEPDGYQKANEKHELKRRQLRDSARKFRLCSPDSFDEGDISELINYDVPSDEEHSMAQVRNGEMSVEVLVVVQHDDGHITLLPGEHKAERWFADTCPSEMDCRTISAQRLRMPHKTKSWLNESKCETLFPMIPAWKKSVWLRQEHLLVLNEHLETVLDGKKIMYREQIGLLIGEEENHGEN